MMAVHTLDPKAGTISIKATMSTGEKKSDVMREKKPDVMKDRSCELQHWSSSGETSNPVLISAQEKSDYTTAQEVIHSALAETAAYDKS